jgi:hypothetical protein
MELSPLARLTSFRNRFGNGATSPTGGTPRNPNLPEPGGPLGIVAGQPMALWTTPSIFGSFDSSAASIPFSRSTEPFSSRPGNAVDDRSAAFFPTDDAANTPNAPIGLAGRIAALAALNPGSPERPTSLSRNGGLQSVNNDDELSWLIQLLSRRQR